MRAQALGTTMEMEGFEMRISLLSIPLLLAAAHPAPLWSQNDMPFIRSVEPGVGKAGDVLVLQGANLGQDSVAALYLTDRKNDFKVVMIEQTAESIRFKIPSEATPGRFALMVLTTGKDPRLVEQPVKVTIERETTNLIAPPQGGQTAPAASSAAPEPAHR